MALSTHVTNRYGTNTEFLRSLTNHDDRDATTVNTTRLGYATDAAEGQFPIHAQEAYDDTDAAHIEAGVTGVIAYLRLWSSAQGKAEGALKEFREMLAAIRKTSAGKRITATATDPTTTKIDYFEGMSPDPRTASDDIDT